MPEMARRDNNAAGSGTGNGRSVRLAFGRRVRELRKAHGYTQEGFAAASGLDRSYYGRIERGEQNVSLENISAVAGALGVPIGELFPSPDARREILEEGS